MLAYVLAYVAIAIAVIAFTAAGVIAVFINIFIVVIRKMCVVNNTNFKVGDYVISEFPQKRTGDRSYVESIRRVEAIDGYKMVLYLKDNLYRGGGYSSVVDVREHSFRKVYDSPFRTKVLAINA